MYMFYGIGRLLEYMFYGIGRLLQYMLGVTYHYIRIDSMICKLTGPGDDHGGILPCHEKSITRM